MPLASHTDENLVRGLPLPLAQLYRRACNGREAFEVHQAAYFLWEAALKLLASGALVAYAERGALDPRISERLTTLIRPSLGHWWEYARLLVPCLADAGEPGYAEQAHQLFERFRPAAVSSPPFCTALEWRHLRLQERFHRE